MFDPNHALNQKPTIIAQRKREVILSHDNARLHVIEAVKDTYRHFKSLSTCHFTAAASASSDYYLIQSMERYDPKTYFRTNELLKNCLMNGIYGNKNVFHRGKMENVLI